jgi:hypothetical protein
MRRLLTIAALLALGACTDPQKPVLKQVLDAAPAQARSPVNCTTQHAGVRASYTTCN